MCDRRANRQITTTHTASAHPNPRREPPGGALGTKEQGPSSFRQHGVQCSMADPGQHPVGSLGRSRVSVAAQPEPRTTYASSDPGFGMHLAVHESPCPPARRIWGPCVPSGRSLHRSRRTELAGQIVKTMEVACPFGRVGAIPHSMGWILIRMYAQRDGAFRVIASGCLPPNPDSEVADLLTARPNLSSTFGPSFMLLGTQTMTAVYRPRPSFRR